ncbi:MAG: glycosyltransferase family 25 protein [Gammaproteobacteria bacterium]
MKIFVISLSDQHERRAQICAQLSPLGLDFEFFDAIRGSEDPFGHFAGTSSWQYRLNTRRDPLPNEVGCYASHLTVWKNCARMGDPIVVMEDDFVVQDNFSAAISTARDLVGRYGFIRLEPFKREPRLTRTRRGAVKVLEQQPFALYYLADPPLCMTAYAISPRAARVLADASETLVGPVDKFMQRTWQHGVPIFALDPAPVTVSTHADVSTIGSRREKSRNPLLLVARLLYKGVGQVRRNRFNAQQLASLDISSEQPER